MITSLILTAVLGSCPRQAVVSQSYVQQYADYHEVSVNN